ALNAVKTAISSVSSIRGTLGATESRLRVAINNLTVARENFAAAESRIRDADIAAEAAELTRLTILQQAGAAVLAQANQQPALALSLLR
ncbi:MAG: flagellin, partial [Deltaproteobacteria bacterium]|nr:flagellin [Deltaproteobacteria bacterium]